MRHNNIRHESSIAATPKASRLTGFCKITKIVNKRKKIGKKINRMKQLTIC
jgi:hypothetical protein